MKTGVSRLSVGVARLSKHSTGTSQAGLGSGAYDFTVNPPTQVSRLLCCTPACSCACDFQPGTLQSIRALLWMCKVPQACRSCILLALMLFCGFSSILFICRGARPAALLPPWPPPTLSPWAWQKWLSTLPLRMPWMTPWLVGGGPNDGCHACMHVMDLMHEGRQCGSQGGW